MIYIYIYIPIGSMYGIYGNIYHQYTPNVSIYTIHGSYGIWLIHKKYKRFAKLLSCLGTGGRGQFRLGQLRGTAAVHGFGFQLWTWRGPNTRFGPRFGRRKDGFLLGKPWEKHRKTMENRMFSCVFMFFSEEMIETTFMGITMVLPP